MTVPFTNQNLGEGPEGDWSWLTPERGYSRYINTRAPHDEQYSSSPDHWWGVASHNRPSTETGQTHKACSPGLEM